MADQQPAMSCAGKGRQGPLERTVNRCTEIEREHRRKEGSGVTYARDHRRAVRRIKEKQQKKGETLRKWEKKRLEHDKQLSGGEKKGE